MSMQRHEVASTLMHRCHNVACPFYRLLHFCSALEEFNNLLEAFVCMFVTGPMCKVNYLTQRGKNIQLVRILCFIFIPLLCVWGFTIFSLYDNVQSRNEIETVSYVTGLC